MNRVTILTMETSCIGDQACHNDDDDDGGDDDGDDDDYVSGTWISAAFVPSTQWLAVRIHSSLKIIMIVVRLKILKATRVIVMILQQFPGVKKCQKYFSTLE